MSTEQLKEFKEGITAEHVMLVFLLVLSAVFFVEPIVQEYPDDARVFPQLTAAAVLVGVSLLLVRNYLPGPIRTFVAEEMTITADTSDIEETVEEDSPEDEAEVEYEKESIGKDYGYEFDDTVFTVGTAVIFFFAGWAAGLLIAAPVYVLFFTLWYKINPIKSVFLAVLSAVILWVFLEFLGMPFDRGAIFDFSPLLPLLIENLATQFGGGR